MAALLLTWVAEGADHVANAAGPTIARVGLTVHEAVASTWVSNQLEDDTENFSGFITKTFGDAIGFLLDDLFIWGTGSGQPLGIMHAPALLSIARNAGFGTVLSDDFANMAARFLPGSLGKGVYLINQTVLQTLANDATTGANANAFLDLSNLKCLGMDIIVTEKCAASASLGDVILADFSQYVIGEREMIVSASRHAAYSSNTYGWFQNQTLWKVTLRVDGQPLLASAITPRRGGSTLSSYVALTVAS